MLKLIWQHSEGLKLKAAIGMAAKVVEVAFDLIVPLLIARLIDLALSHTNTQNIFSLSAGILCLFFIGFGFTLICQYMAAVVSQSIGSRLREALFSKILALSEAEYQHIPSSSTLTRINSDSFQIQLACALGIRQLVRWPLLAAGSIACALAIRPKLGLIFLICVPAVGLIFYIIMRKTVVRFSRIQELLDRISRIASESLSGIRTLRVFNQEERFASRFNELAVDQQNEAISASKLSSLLNPGTLLILDLGIAAILQLGAGEIFNGSMSRGELMAFVNYMMQCLVAIAYVANLIVVFTKGAASAKRVQALLDLPLSYRPNTQPLTKAGSVILSVRDLTFSYQDSEKPSLEGINFELKAGESLGIIGGTGSGKSTLVKLLLGNYPYSTGSIRFFGQELSDTNREELNQAISVVFQKASLLAGSLRENLQMRNPAASDAELLEALELAQAKDFVEAAQGLDTPVEAHGVNFSGGQRQRLSIARALVSVGDLLILDDASSALDLATEAKLRPALGKLAREKGLSRIVISQRVSSLMHCDKILLLHHGKQVALADHKTLLENSELYQEICASQHILKEAARG